MSVILRACKFAMAGFGLATIVVGCSAETGDEELQSSEQKASGGRWQPVEVSAPNGVGSYEGPDGSKCTGGLKPGAKALGIQLSQQFNFKFNPGTATKPGDGYSCRANTANTSQLSIHAFGRALDLMMTGSKGDQVANHLAKNAAALGVTLIIWNRTSWTIGKNGPRSKQYGGPSPHTDHVHVEISRAMAAGDGPVDVGVDPSEPDTRDPRTGNEDDEPIAQEPDDELNEGPGGSQDPNGGCVRLSPAELCAEAFMFGGIQCGTIRDECGNVANCDTVPMLGCGPSETCGPDHRCQRTGPEPCAPKSPAQACSEARSNGLTCGAIPDGCGGQVNCDTQAGFGCKEDERCSGNKCAAKLEPPDPTGPGRAADNDGDDPSPESKDGDDTGKDKKDAKPKKPTASGGCSTTPGESTANGAAGFLGLALAVGLSRRRRNGRAA